MTDSLYLLGAPGVGKSTAMATWLDSRDMAVAPDPSRVKGKLVGHGLYNVLTGDTQGVYLGRMREDFPGTDGLSMAVAPDARAWAGTLSRRHEGGMNYVVGEGQRLGNPGFLTALAENTWLTIVLLSAHPDALTARRDERGSTQSPSWMQGAATQARNTFQEMTKRGVNQAIEIDTTNLTPDEIAERISRSIP
ncbi:hypothetical protein QDA03_gp03 [Microbacterium phage Terij]|uniref:Uncharacterized protein n=1 Tax=Microbacterium phage Terij TaxID=2686229 RepID=A0A6B9LCF2_9CAUD|nr:hypothetical protein QDA03_gp03 [Microbacterium phage Terij]QHB37138.1 hypothetical protein SEA_TERIJ_3 [Microbacterium phage Terij]